jgi:DNA adenine methylase
VTVTCLDFPEFIRRVDGKGALVYLDPPYWGSEGDYGKHLFSRERFEELAVVLGG